jgi:hypothetical protein
MSPPGSPLTAPVSKSSVIFYLLFYILKIMGDSTKKKHIVSNTVLFFLNG